MLEKGLVGADGVAILEAIAGTGAGHKKTSPYRMKIDNFPKSHQCAPGGAPESMTVN